MSQEFERIKFHLSQLQKELLQNQFSGIALKHLDSFSQKNSFDVHQWLSQFTQSLINVQTQLFVAPIARNIHSIKEQNIKLKNELEEFKSQMIGYQTEKKYLMSAINQIQTQKNLLGLKLNMDNEKFEELEQLVGSSDFPHKIKEMIKQSGQAKEKLRLRDLMIEERSAGLKEMLEKESFYISEIRALQNDNCLFHRDLANCQTKIQRMGQEIKNMKDQKEKLMREYEDLKQREIKAKLGQEELSEVVRVQKEKISEVQEQKKKEEKKVSDLISQINERIQQVQEFQKRQVLYLEQIKSLEKLKHDLQIKNNEIWEKNQGKDIEVDQYRQKLEETKMMANCLADEKQREISQLRKDLTEKKLSLVQLNEQFTYKNQNLQKEIQNLQLQLATCKGKVNILQQRYFQKQQNQIKLKQELRILQNDLVQIGQKLESSYSQVSQLEELNHNYRLYQEENTYLKQQLNREQQPQAKYPKFSKKGFFQFVILKETLQSIKSQNQRIKNLVHNSIETMQKWMVLSINQLISILMETKNLTQDYSGYPSKDFPSLVCPNKAKNSLKLKDRYQLVRTQNQMLRNRIKFVLGE